MAHLTGRRRPTGPSTQAHTATPTDSTVARPSDAVHLHTHGPTEGLIPQALVTSGAQYLPATTHDGLAPQRHHAPPTGPTARPAEPSSPSPQPPARAPAWTWHAPPPRRATHSPRAQEADPTRRPLRKATPEGQHNRGTMKPNRLHCRPNRSAGSPRWARKKCGGPHNGHQRQHQWGSLAGERTGRQCRMPTHRT